MPKCTNISQELRAKIADNKIQLTLNCCSSLDKSDLLLSCCYEYFSAIIQSTLLLLSQQCSELNRTALCSGESTVFYMTNFSSTFVMICC